MTWTTIRVNAISAGARRGLRQGLWAWRLLTAPLRTLPDFLIIGAQKGGTTSLYNYLLAHPYVRPAWGKKEVGFFNLNYGQGQAWYRAHFPLRPQRTYARRVRGEDLISGEGTPEYLAHPHVPQRAHALAPQASLIVLLRNPVDRAYSHYYHERGKGREPLSFEEAIAAEAERLAGELEKMQADEGYYSWPHRRYSYLRRGLYADQLQVWLRFFPREQFLILKSEAFYADPSAALERTVTFLGLPTQLPQPWKPARYKKYLESDYAPMDPATRQRLLDHFAPHNERLYALLGMDFGWEA